MVDLGIENERVIKPDPLEILVLILQMKEILKVNTTGIEVEILSNTEQAFFQGSVKDQSAVLTAVKRVQHHRKKEFVDLGQKLGSAHMAMNADSSMSHP